MLPTEMIRDDPSLDLPFFLYWANEILGRHGSDRTITVVWEQKYGTERCWKAQFDYCFEFFKDDRYYQIDGMPVYAIYNAWAIPDMDHVIDLWNGWAKRKGSFRESIL
jgi:phytoene/squalene synthetase